MVFPFGLQPAAADYFKLELLNNGAGVLTREDRVAQRTRDPPRAYSLKLKNPSRY